MSATRTVLPAHKFTRRAAGVLAALLVCGNVADVVAQSVASPNDLALATLDELMNVTITTASRKAEGMAGAAARVQVITRAQIERRGYRSLSDVLKDLPDFKVDLGGDPDNPAQLTVDGVRGSDRVVVLLDGIRISSPTNEPLPILGNYPVHAARQIEVVYGPASALYGADAFSSVINIISNDVSDAPGLSVTTSIGQFGLYNQTGSYGARLGPKASVMISGQVLSDRQPDLSRYYPADFHGLVGQRSGTFNTIFGPMTSSRPVSPDYNIPLAAHSFQATVRAGGLQAMVFENRSRAPTAPTTNPDNAVYNADAFNQNTLWVAAVTHTRSFGSTVLVSAGTFSRHELDPQSGYWNVYSNMDKSYKYAYGSMAKIEEQLTLKLSRSVVLTTGGTFEHFHSIPQGADLNAPLVSRETAGTNLGTNIPDALIDVRYANTGAFGQAQYTITPAVALTIGARADYNTRYGGTLNPRIGLVSRSAHGTTAKVLYGTAYLAPSPYQAYAHYGSFYSTDGGQTYASSYWHLPNPNLRPQQKKSLEFNLLQNVGSYAHVTAAAFYSAFNHPIKEADADQSYAGTYLGWPVDYIDFAVNEGHANTYGGSLGIDVVRVFGSDRRIEGHAAVVVANGRTWEEDASESDANLPIGAMAPVQVRLGGDIDWHRWSLAPRLALVGRQRLLATLDDDPSTRRTLPGYATVDVSLRRHALYNHVDVFVTIENALDARYHTINAHAYSNPEELIGSPQNPRRFTVGLELRLP